MKKDEFCVVHDTITTQILIDSGFDHEEEKFYLRVKFWSNNINGYIDVTPKWGEEYETDFRKFLNELKDIDEAIKFANNTLDLIGSYPELEK